MTRITQDKLAAMVQTIAQSQKTTRTAENNKGINSQRLHKKVKTPPAEYLGHRLADQYKISQNTEPQDIPTEALQYVVNELIVWELGEQLLKHPEFRSISEFILNQVKNDRMLNQSFRTMVLSLVKNAD